MNILKLTTIILFATCKITAATPPDSIPQYFTRQTTLFPQEKVYVQTDKSTYIAGEQIWFRAYLVDARSHSTDCQSNFIYAELIDPWNNLISRIKIMNNNGVYSGNIRLEQNLPTGNYMLRFYTRYMQNNNNSNGFQKNIHIGNYFSARYPIESSFEPGGKKNEIAGKLIFKEFGKSEPILPEKIRIYDQKGEAHLIKPDENKTIDLRLDMEKTKNKTLCLDYNIGSNTHKQFINITDYSDNFDVTFFPEGGHLPENTVVRIAFKALNASGMSENIKGLIISNKGDTVSQFESNSLGMGAFVFRNDPTQNYYALCKNNDNHEKRFEIPATTKRALSLRTDWRKENLYISLNKSPETNLPDSVYLMIQCRAQVVYGKVWNDPTQPLCFSNNSLPTGVLQVMLIDKNNIPLSERLVFNTNKNDKTNVLFSSNKKEYKKREKVDATIRIIDNKGKDLPAQISVSVTDNKLVRKDSCVNILSSLLLTSELKGYIESPAYYFYPENTTAPQDLDLLLMTQGWSRYNVSEVMQGKYTLPPLLPETTQQITGKVLRGLELNKPAPDYPVMLIVSQNSNTLHTKTDNDGTFYFKNMLFCDSTQFAVICTTPKGKSSVKLTITNDTFPAINYFFPSDRKKIKANNTVKESTDFHFLNHGSNAGIRMYQLDEVTVSASYKKKDEITRNPLASVFNKRVGKEELLRTHPKNVMDLLAGIAGISIWTAGSYPYPYITNLWDGITPPPSAFLLVDGTEVGPEHLNAYMPQQITEVEVVKGGRIATVGPKGIYGAILITTGIDTSYNASPVENIRKITPLGYQITKEFYSPKYETKKQQNNPIPDTRSTIYWNPDVKTTEKEKGAFQFYTADMPESYSVIIEGITADGKLIYKEEKLGADD